jgi:hypothetical protein
MVSSSIGVADGVLIQVEFLNQPKWNCSVTLTMERKILDGLRISR